MFACLDSSRKLNIVQLAPQNLSLGEPDKTPVEAVVEGDMEGRYSSPKFNVTLLAPIKPFDLAVQLAEKTGWISPWNYLEMKMGHTGGRDIKDPKALTFPREKTLFDDNLKH